MSDLLLITTVIVLAVALGAMTVLFLRRKGAGAPLQQVRSTTIADRVRAVGKLVGLEVHAKEIATTTKGWSWVPPILLSQARIAMIFHFEKQYFVDLTRITERDVDETGPGRYTLRLPPVEGTLRLTDVEPYDIQAGRVLGLIDVIQMNAETQSQLMRAAQDQAATLYTKSERRYLDEARRSVQRQLESLLALFDAQVEVVWAQPQRPEKPGKVAIEDELEHRLTALASGA